MWKYDIHLMTTNGIDKHYADSEDLEFETKEEARADADDFIISDLADRLNCNVHDFIVEVYEKED